MFNRKKQFICILFILLFLLFYIEQLSQYITAYSKLLDNYTEKKESNKYIVYECIDGMLCGGWGDRLKGIYSAYAWSLISGRKFYININKPCRLTNMLVPNKIKWNTNFTELYKNNPKKEYFDRIDRVSEDNIRNYRLEEFERNSTDIIIIRNNLDWLEHMSKNVNIKQKLINLGYEPDEFKMQFVFKKWYNDLFRLSERFSNKYVNFLNKIKQNKNEILICAQIRIGGAREYVNNDENFTMKNNTVVYWNHIRNVFLKNVKDFKLFLTTDTRSVEVEAKKLFGSDKLVINDGLNTHLDRESNLHSDCSRVDKTFLDFHCLQNCDKAIISESGFGKLGTWLV